MSSSALGDTAVCGRLVCSTLENKNQRVLKGGVVTAAGAVPTNGLHFIAPPANPTAYTLAAGDNEGDVVELIHNGGANQADIAVTDLHGAATAIAMTGGQSVRLIWGGAPSGLGGGWYLVGRESTSVVASGAVNLPTIA